MKQRLEFSDGKSRKFWEIEVSGKSHTVRYGRLGSTGRSVEKTFASNTAAVADAAKQIAAKTSKGYVATESSKKSRAAKRSTEQGSKARKATTRSGATEPITIYRHGEQLEFVYQIKRDLWSVGLEDDGDLFAAESLEDAIDGRGIERWRFANETEASKALQAMTPRRRDGSSGRSLRARCLNKLQTHQSRSGFTRAQASQLLWRKVWLSYAIDPRPTQVANAEASDSLPGFRFAGPPNILVGGPGVFGAGGLLNEKDTRIFLASANPDNELHSPVLDYGDGGEWHFWAHPKSSFGKAELLGCG